MNKKGLIYLGDAAFNPSRYMKNIYLSDLLFIRHPEELWYLFLFKHVALITKDALIKKQTLWTEEYSFNFRWWQLQWWAVFRHKPPTGLIRDSKWRQVRIASLKNC
jgi:hypothetical protein